MEEFTLMNDLAKLVIKYGSDKFLGHYTECYDKVFKHIRPQIKNVLEIGIGTVSNCVSSASGFLSYYDYYKPGASLRAWRDYFPNAQVLGIDIADDCMFTEERIETMLLSSTDKIVCNFVLKDRTFDMILDDGWHRADAQLATLQNFFPRVVPGGYYIIEDIGGGGDDLSVFYHMEKEVMDVIGQHEWYYRGNVLIIGKNFSGLGDMGRDGHGLPARDFSPPPIQ